MSDEPDPRAWHDHAMWWHVYPLGACGAPVRPDGDDPAVLGGEGQPVVHRLGRLERWLDHVVDLGLNGILLGPVLASATHGYDVVDHLRVDPRLGDEEDLARLVEAAHARGVRVALDGVFNHVGRDHAAFARLREEGPDAPTADMFRVDWDGWQPGQEPAADRFEGHDLLVELDHDADAVVDLVVEAMVHWLDRGIDGWRLDAAYAVPPGFWARVVPRVRERHPGAWLHGELIHGDAAAYVAESGLDSLTQYELWQGIWHALADRNLFELEHAVGRHDALLPSFVPTTFVGNHDVTRVASAVGADLLPHAVATWLTVAGTPLLYAGDEYGRTGVKEERVGGDDAVRPALPDDPPAVADLDDDAARALDLHRTLLGLRRRHPWLVRAHTDVVHVASESLVLRTACPEGAVVTCLNLADDAVDLPAGGADTVHAGDGDLDAAPDGHVRLPARGWTVLGHHAA